MKKKKKNWFYSHVNDPYVKKAESQGFRARSYFKILEIDQKFHLIKKNTKVLDLGSSPGAWSQYAVQISGKNNVYAVDCNDMEHIDGVLFKKVNILTNSFLEKHKDFFGFDKFDLVISDIAPNISGIKLTDLENMNKIVDSIFLLIDKALKKNGFLVMKLFFGSEIGQVKAKFKNVFKKFSSLKLKSSKPKSTEIYLIGISKM
jgi:23S rRNA (uridine2552-2'-O)-methyltransferase